MHTVFILFLVFLSASCQTVRGLHSLDFVHCHFESQLLVYSHAVFCSFIVTLSWKCQLVHTLYSVLSNDLNFRFLITGRKPGRVVFKQSFSAPEHRKGVESPGVPRSLEECRLNVIQEQHNYISGKLKVKCFFST